MRKGEGRGSGRLRQILGSAALFVMALAVGLLITEAALRIFELAPPQGISTVNGTEFERLPGIYAPLQDIVDVSVPALPHRVRIDSLGYRGAAFARNKADDELRVFFTGDSFTYGDFVDDSVTLPVLLEATLGRACRSVRVINAGLRGSTIIGQRALVERGRALAADLVLVMYSENDVTDMIDPLWYRLAENRRLKSRWPMSWLYPTLRHTALWNLALRVRATARAREQAQVEVNEATVADTTPVRRDAHEIQRRLREEYLEELDGLFSDLRDRDIPFAIALYPSHYTVSADTPPSHLAWLAEWARDRDLPMVDLTVPLRASALPDTTLYLLPHDGHPSPTGYRIAARTIADSLVTLPALGAACGTP